MEARAAARRGRLRRPAAALAVTALVAIAAPSRASGAAPLSTTEDDAQVAALTEIYLDAVLDLSLAFRFRARWDEADRLVRGARETLRGGVDRTGEGRVIAEQGWIAFDRRFADAGGFRPAAQLFSEARRIAEAAGDASGLADALEGLGMSQYGEALLAQAGDYDEARAQFSAALRLRREAAGGAGAAESLFHIGLTYEQQGRRSDAAAHYEAALARAGEEGDSLHAAYALRHLGGLRQDEGDLRVALEFHRRCLEMRRQIGFVRGVPAALLSIAEVEERLGHGSRALEAAVEALETARTMGLRRAAEEAGAAVARIRGGAAEAPPPGQAPEP